MTLSLRSILSLFGFTPTEEKDESPYHCGSYNDADEKKNVLIYRIVDAVQHARSEKREVSFCYIGRDESYDLSISPNYPYFCGIKVLVVDEKSHFRLA